MFKNKNLPWSVNQSAISPKFVKSWDILIDLRCLSEWSEKTFPSRKNKLCLWQIFHLVLTQGSCMMCIRCMELLSVCRLIGALMANWMAKPWFNFIAKKSEINWHSKIHTELVEWEPTYQLVTLLWNKLLIQVKAYGLKISPLIWIKTWFYKPSRPSVPSQPSESVNKMLAKLLT